MLKVGAEFDLYPKLHFNAVLAIFQPCNGGMYTVKFYIKMHEHMTQNTKQYKQKKTPHTDKQHSPPSTPPSPPKTPREKKICVTVLKRLSIIKNNGMNHSFTNFLSHVRKGSLNI